jgi:predicted nucleotide-binding protein (sugar kinase/HSP70/actin superfamily)
MPEIVAGSIMPSVTKDYDIPVLTLVMDEITGEAGYITRIDAFVDMLRRRRQIKEANNELVLSGH